MHARVRLLERACLHVIGHAKQTTELHACWQFMLCALGQVSMPGAFLTMCEAPSHSCSQFGSLVCCGRIKRLADQAPSIGLTDLMRVAVQPSLLQGFNPFLSQAARRCLGDAIILWLQVGSRKGSSEGSTVWRCITCPCVSGCQQSQACTHSQASISMNHPVRADA